MLAIGKANALVIFASTWALSYHPGQDKEMPSLFRFLLVAGLLAGGVMSGLYVLATRYEPEQQIISKPVPGVKIRRETIPQTPKTE